MTLTGSLILGLNAYHGDASACLVRDGKLVAESSVLITHAGAGSVINAIRAGKRPIVMPRRALLGEHVDGHQLELADALGAAGKVVVAENVAQLRQAIAEAQVQVRPTETPRLVGEIAALLKKYAHG